MPDSKQTGSPDETELRHLWNRAYPDGKKRTHAYVLKGDETWEGLQPKHLPLTLKVMVDRGLDTRGALQDDSTVTRFREADPSSKALILMVGYSLEQLALCVAYQCLVFRCRKFVPFFSENTHGLFQQEIGRLLKMMGITIDDGGGEKTVEWIDERVIKDPNDPSQVFKAIVRWIREAKSGLGGIARLESFAVDATGGQKPMDSGASAAAGFYGIPAFYLHFTAYDDKLRKPVPDTLRYSRLILPDVTFSHHNRVALHAAIGSAQFERADERLSDIRQAMELYPDYFDPESKGNIEKVSRVVEESRNWFEQGYAAESDARERAGLGRFWRMYPRRDPRRMMETLLRLCGSDPDDRDGGPWLLFQYVADEYHRLNLLSRQGHHRDVVMGSRGLAELVIDALLSLPWFGNCCRLANVSVVQIRDPSPEIEEAAKDKAPFKNQLAGSFRSFFDSRLRRIPAFLHLNVPKKFSLLTKGEAQFENVRARPISNGKLIDRWGRYKPLVRETDGTRNRRKATYVVFCIIIKSDKVVITNCDATEARRSLAFPEGDWDDARNALTHLRTPLNSDIRDLSGRIIENYLPRMIELFYRMLRHGEPVGFEDVVSERGKGCTWLNDRESDWTEGSRVPWKRKDLDFTSLLEIEPLVGTSHSTRTHGGT